MPKLWTETIDAHRTAVQDAIMDKTAELAADEGLATLTMSRIANEAGIGRATLYKYFGDVDAILASWHRRKVTRHLASLHEIRDRSPDPLAALEGVLLAYAEILRQRHGRRGRALGAMLHGLPHVHDAHEHLLDFVTDLVEDAKGRVEAAASSRELARYILGAIAAAEAAPSKPASQRLVQLIMRGLDVR